jgi:hypothetical protein
VSEARRVSYVSYDDGRNLFGTRSFVEQIFQVFSRKEQNMGDPAAPARVTENESLEQLAELPAGELIARYRQGLSTFDSRLFELSDEQMDLAFLPDAGVGRWPIRVLLGHIADAELAYTHRMRRAIAEENPVLAGWDHEAFIDSGLYTGQPVAALIAVTHTLRRWTAEWLLTLTSEQLGREALHPERGAESVLQMAGLATWHLEHHGRYLNAKICRLLGPAPAAKEPGGCGTGCGCASRATTSRT